MNLASPSKTNSHRTLSLDPRATTPYGRTCTAQIISRSLNRRFRSASRGLLQVGGQLIARGADVRAALEKLRERARAELDRRENQWRPIRRQLLEWLPTARRGQDAAARMATVRAATDWLTRVEDDVRAERFRPIAERARRFWETMGKGSSGLP